MKKTDVVIVGGGIIGLATAYRLGRRYPDKKITLLEKESRPAYHQSGRNSGVLHSGIYYRPDSLRAKNCRTGKEAMVAFCQEHGIDHDICGKVIVAVDKQELPALENIYQRGQQNGVRCEMIGPDRLHELEPHSAGIKAIYVPDAGIVHYRQVCDSLGKVIKNHGGRIITGARVTGFKSFPQEIVVESTVGEIAASYVVNCTGLHCDRVAKLSGSTPEAQIIPFRGEFFTLKKEARYLCKNLIYPVPDPSFPFLGVHFTRMTDGSVECGPNAVLAFAREGYRKRDINLYDLYEALTYPGFIKLATKYWRVGLGEMKRSFSKKTFVTALQRLLPEIRSEHLDHAPAGVRAQALSPDGSIVDDFLFQEAGRVVNVCNAPSPAATASLNIGNMIVDRLSQQFS